MIDALKKLDKKFIMMFCCIICLPILLIIFLAIIKGCSNNKITYEKYETKMLEAAEKYIKDNDNAPKEEAQVKKITLAKLVEDGYIKSTNKLLDDDSCTGGVTVRKNGTLLEENNKGYLNYVVNLNCKNYTTKNLKDSLISNIVNEGSGLYKIEDGYIFKGDKPKNYITFYGKKYRIMSIDNEGIVKLVKDEKESDSKMWDNKFNIETNSYSGINIYKDSKISDYLLNFYKGLKDDAKSHIVAQNICVGKRLKNDFSINKSLVCSEIVEKQVVSLINISDYALASLDVNCNLINSKSCNNYNYLRGKISGWTLNSASDNAYQIAYLSNGTIEYKDANNYGEYYVVIYIDGNEQYLSGKGTQEDPYVIK